MRDPEHDAFADGLRDAYGEQQRPPFEDNFVEAPRSSGKRRAPRSDDIVTEDSAALLFAAQYKGSLRFCHDTGTWFEHNGSVWQKNRTRLAFQWGRELARKLAEHESPKARYCIEKTSFATGLERFARVDPELAVSMDSWDQDPWLLGTPGGTVDLRTGQLRKADPDDGITKSTADTPAESAECPLWLKFLDEATGSDRELIQFLKEWCGYALTGITREHTLVFIYGPGGNGKSVFLNVLTAILSAYAATAAMDTFTASRGRQAPDRPRHAARRPAGDRFRDGRRPGMGRGSHQANDRRGPDHGSLHAAGLLYLRADVQAHHCR
jgi:putative DNA primase/helicase